MSDNVSPEDLRLHLTFIQQAIARMSAASSVAKGWCLTVTSAELGYSITRDSAKVAALGLFSTVLFGMLDARYLREERKYRALYEGARNGAVAIYDMRAHNYGKKADPLFDPRCAWRSVAASWSLWILYGALVVASIATMVGQA